MIVTDYHYKYNDRTKLPWQFKHVIFTLTILLLLLQTINEKWQALVTSVVKLLSQLMSQPKCFGNLVIFLPNWVEAQNDEGLDAFRF